MYSQFIEGFGVQLHPLTRDHIELVRQWRNHPDISSKMFAQASISAQQQQQWFSSLSTKKDVGFWLVHYQDEPIAVINVKCEQGIIEDASTLEAGFYMAPDGRYSKSILAFCPSLALIDFFFSNGTQQMQAKVKHTNQSALRYNETLGYSTVSTNKKNQNADIVTMQLDHQQFAIAKDKLSKLIRF